MPFLARSSAVSILKLPIASQVVLLPRIDPMSLFYKQNAAARFFVDQTNGKVYEVVGGSAALLCWRNGVKEREKVAELPPGLDELWGGEDLAWSLVRQ